MSFSGTSGINMHELFVMYWLEGSQN